MPLFMPPIARKIYTKPDAMSLPLHQNLVNKPTTPPIGLGADADADTEKQTASEAADKPPAPPDGGLTAWLQVVGAFFLFFNSW